MNRLNMMWRTHFRWTKASTIRKKENAGNNFRTCSVYQTSVEHLSVHILSDFQYASFREDHRKFWIRSRTGTMGTSANFFVWLLLCELGCLRC